MAPRPATPIRIVSPPPSSAGQRAIIARDARMRSPRALSGPLERLYREFDYRARIGRDAIQYPLRYPDPHDRELVSLLTACLAYGRVDLFGKALERVLTVMGPSPRAFVCAFDPVRHADVFASFYYRF